LPALSLSRNRNSRQFNRKWARQGKLVRLRSNEIPLASGRHPLRRAGFDRPSRL